MQRFPYFHPLQYSRNNPLHRREELFSWVADGTRSVWLSVTGAGMFEVEAKNQIVDEWSRTNPGLHVTISPIIPNPHSLFHIIDSQMVFIDKDNQQGGITFPPLPGGLPPGEVTPPIYLPPPGGGETPPGGGGETPPGGGGETPPGGGTTPPTGGVPSTPGQTNPSRSEGAVPPVRVPPQNYLPSKFKESISFNKRSTAPKNDGYAAGESTAPQNNGYAAGDRSIANSKNSGFINEAPVTAGRRFANEPYVNVWVDGRYFYVKDFRFGLDRKGYLTNLSIGADRRVTDDLVLGAMLAYNNGKSLAFNDNWEINARGFTVGPYFGYRILPNWSVEGMLGIGKLENHNNILILNGEFNSTVYSSSLLFRGVYNVCNIQLQAKPAIYYTYFHNKSYMMNGIFNGTFFSLPVSTFNGAYGFAQFGLEAGLPIKSANDTITTIPYIELGVDYAFIRPNHGQILTGNLTMQGTSPWSGLARVGVRTMITSTFFLETTASYMSIGQNNLDIWQARLFL